MGEIKGKVIHIFKEERVSEKMKKREFVISYMSGKFPKEICFQTINDRVDIIDPYTVGDEITVSYELSSREYKGKYYTQATAWKIAGTSEHKHEAFKNDEPINMGEGDLSF